jgi:hypothetical protein
MNYPGIDLLMPPAGSNNPVAHRLLSVDLLMQDLLAAGELGR